MKAFTEPLTAWTAEPTGLAMTALPKLFLKAEPSG